MNPSGEIAVVCFAHVTNQMGNIEGDFEKGQDNGSRGALPVIVRTAKRFFGILTAG